MAKTAHKDPTEMVSCGNCSKVNDVPFGLDRFKCYNCGTMVAISREPTAACAAASTTALYYDGLQEGPAPAETKKSDGSSSFFKNIQKTMDKTLQKVEKAFAPPAKPSPRSSAPVREGPPMLSTEEEQLQWALDASMADSQHAVLSGAVAEAERAVISGQPAPMPASAATAPPPASAVRSTPSASAGDQLQAAAAQAAQRLQQAEERAQKAEAELKAVKDREAAAVAERDALRRKLAENERLVQGLTEQLDTVNRMREETAKTCQALERSLQSAREAEAAALLGQAAEETSSNEAEEGQQGTVCQLIARIAELEGQLQQATHFAAPSGEEVPKVEAAVTDELQSVLEASLRDMGPGGLAEEESQEEEESQVAAALEIGKAVAEAGETGKTAEAASAEAPLAEAVAESEAGLEAPTVEAVAESEKGAPAEVASADTSGPEQTKKEEESAVTGAIAAQALTFQPPARGKGEGAAADVPTGDASAKTDDATSKEKQEATAQSA